MPISPSTLDSWARHDTAATTSAQNTHERIRNELKNSDTLGDVDFDTYLQGSYRNYTIVRGSSDVDIVAHLTSIYYADVSDLSPEEQERWRQGSGNPSYSWQHFRNDVINVLQDIFGPNAIDTTGKAIEVDSDKLDLNADVLVCADHRDYYSYPSGYHSGIAFFDQTNTKVVNYPKKHIDRGETKQSKTNNRFKETVRIFKRARNQLVSQGDLQKENVPSYFIENLLYRVPESKYVHDRQDRYVAITEYLRDTDYSGWRCQNGITELFGNGSTRWDTRYADAYVEGLIELWNDS